MKDRTRNLFGMPENTRKRLRDQFVHGHLDEKDEKAVSEDHSTAQQDTC